MTIFLLWPGTSQFVRLCVTPSHTYVYSFYFVYKNIQIRVIFYLVAVICKFSLPQKTFLQCQKMRIKELAIKRRMFRSKQFTFNNGKIKLPVPVLKMTQPQILQYSMFNSFLAHHANLYILGVIRPVRKVREIALKTFAGKDFTTLKEYFSVENFFRKALKVS